MKSLYQNGWRVQFFNGSFGWCDNEAGARYAQNEQGLKVEPWQVMGSTFMVCEDNVRQGHGRPRVVPEIVVDAPFKGGWRVTWTDGSFGWTEDLDNAWQQHVAGYNVQPWAVQGLDYKARKRAVWKGQGAAAWQHGRSSVDDEHGSRDRRGPAASLGISRKASGWRS